MLGFGQKILFKKYSDAAHFEGVPRWACFGDLKLAAHLKFSSLSRCSWLKMEDT
jgi:hypothetical protein